MKLITRYIKPTRPLLDWIVIDDNGSIMAWPEGWLYLYHDPRPWTTHKR